MTNTLQHGRVASALDRMYGAAEAQFSTMRDRFSGFSKLASASAQERADAASDL